MNFTLKDQDATSARLVVSVQEADYTTLVEKTLKNIRQKANIPGFRPGMVPMGLIKKQYGTAVKAEEINKLLQTKIFEYIRENNIDILGEPLPDEEQQSTLDLVNGKDFDFEFRIALAPKFDATLTKADNIVYSKIEPTEEMIDGQAKAYAQRCGEYKQMESYESGDMLKGSLVENVEGGIEVKEAVMMPSYMKNDEQKALFEGKKVGDTITFNPNIAFDGHAAELASLFMIEKDKAAEVKSDFNFTIKEITRFVASEINQTVFDAAYGKDTVKSEEEFRAKIKEEIASRFAVESDYKLLLDTRSYLMNRIGKLEYSESILKELMLANKEDKDATIDDVTFQKSLDELTWHLIKEQLVKNAGIKIEEADILEAAKDATRAQFAQYGMGNVPDELLENYAMELVKQGKSKEMLVNRAIDVKLIGAIKEAATLNEESISVEEFNKKIAEND
ncbi:MAG: trigger factor [Bacteroidaceae bacterium]|nr:trigger factor [Bacteroidaceae bacterium]MBQ4039182.1 trigger factor [Bacteroidaceae bacterium]